MGLSPSFSAGWQLLWHLTCRSITQPLPLPHMFLCAPPCLDTLLCSFGPPHGLPLATYVCRMTLSRSDYMPRSWGWNLNGSVWRGDVVWISQFLLGLLISVPRVVSTVYELLCDCHPHTQISFHVSNYSSKRRSLESQGMPIFKALSRKQGRDAPLAPGTLCSHSPGSVAMPACSAPCPCASMDMQSSVKSHFYFSFLPKRESTG
jgi:hypothetical protein